jgi:hypothetical protein
MKTHTYMHTYTQTKGTIKFFFEYYIISNIIICFVLLKNNSYNLLSQLQLVVSNSTISQSIYNLVAKNNENNCPKNNENNCPKKNTSESDDFIDTEDYFDVNKIIDIKINKRKKLNNHLYNLQNINHKDNDDWGWFVYAD